MHAKAASGTLTLAYRIYHFPLKPGVSLHPAMQAIKLTAPTIVTEMQQRKEESAFEKARYSHLHTRRKF